MGRGVAKLKNGDETGEADINAAKAIQAEIAEEYRTLRRELDALAILRHAVP